jgi:hypothetical protein
MPVLRRAAMAVLDLGVSPPCQSVVTPERLEAMERSMCASVSGAGSHSFPSSSPRTHSVTQTAYCSTYSTSWLERASPYAEMITARVDLCRQDFGGELTSNDGYHLQHFVPTGIPIVGSAYPGRGEPSRGRVDLVREVRRRADRCAARSCGEKSRAQCAAGRCSGCALVRRDSSSPRNAPCVTPRRSRAGGCGSLRLTQMTLHRRRGRP